MGLLAFFPRSPTLNLVRIPSGSFTVDAAGQPLISTLPNTFPAAWAKQIGQHFVAVFRDAQAAGLPLRELVLEYSALRVTARHMRGGAIIFLSPQGLGRK